MSLMGIELLETCHWFVILFIVKHNDASKFSAMHRMHVRGIARCTYAT